jgi:hypothetical protein
MERRKSWLHSFHCDLVTVWRVPKTKRNLMSCPYSGLHGKWKLHRMRFCNISNIHTWFMLPSKVIVSAPHWQSVSGSFIAIWTGDRLDYRLYIAKLSLRTIYIRWGILLPPKVAEVWVHASLSCGRSAGNISSKLILPNAHSLFIAAYGGPEAIHLQKYWCPNIQTLQDSYWW